MCELFYLGVHADNINKSEKKIIQIYRYIWSFHIIWF